MSKYIPALILVLATLATYSLVAVPNYKECRDAGHSVQYCFFTHLIGR